MTLAIENRARRALRIRLFDGIPIVAETGDLVRLDEDAVEHHPLVELEHLRVVVQPDGFGVQRVYTEDGTLDETMAVRDGDVVLVPKGHHPCAAVYGFDMYYLNVMAGPRRNWRFQFDPAVAWIAERDG